jgi:hypothetical protein
MMYRYQPPPFVMKSVRKRSFSEVGEGFTARPIDQPREEGSWFVVSRSN